MLFYLWGIDTCQEAFPHQLQVQLLVCPDNMLLVPIFHIQALNKIPCVKMRKCLRNLTPHKVVNGQELMIDIPAPHLLL